jgi:hypothetical protein
MPYNTREKLLAYRKRTKIRKNEIQRLYVERNKEKVRLSNLLSYYKYRDIRVLNCRKYYLKNNKKMNIQSKEYRLKNIEKSRNYFREYQKKKRQDPIIRLSNNISRRISEALHGKKSGKRWESLVGYTIEDLKNHLQKHFTKEMSFNNYGSYWHIDHIKPRCLFKYSSIEDKEFKECWSLNNLRPLEASENMSKGKKYSLDDRALNPDDVI